MGKKYMNTVNGGREPYNCSKKKLNHFNSPFKVNFSFLQIWLNFGGFFFVELSLYFTSLFIRYRENNSVSHANLNFGYID